MNQNMQRTFDLSGGMQQVRHQVLRNTYWLLALSMIPTVLGAFIGVQMHLPMLTGGMGFIIFMAVAFGFMYAIEKTKNSGLGVAVLLGFTFFMGLMLTPILTRTLGYSNGGMLIMTAFGGGHHPGCDGDDRHGLEARLLGHGQMAVRRRDRADPRIGGKHFPGPVGTVDRDLHGRHRHLLGLHPV